MPCLNDVYTGYECDASTSRSLGWDLIFVRWRKKPHLRRFSFRWRKKTHLRGFSTTRKGHLIPGAVVFSIRHGRIFHSRFFSLKTIVPRTIDVEIGSIINSHFGRTGTDKERTGISQYFVPGRVLINFSIPMRSSNEH